MTCSRARRPRGALQPGDILVQVQGQRITTFEPLAAVLDDSVGRTIDVEVERGGQRIEVRLEVQDLHAITPAEYLEFGDAVVHRLSYQMARHFNAPIQGIFVANPGYALGASGVPRGAVITSIGGQPVATLEEFEAALAKLPDGARATLRYKTLDDPQGTQTGVFRMDRRWYPAARCRRDDSTGYWPCRDLAAPPVAEPTEPAVTSFVMSGDPVADRLAPSLVLVNFEMPFSVAGVTERVYHGTGLIVDATRGLVVVDRNTVPVSVGDVRITVAGSIEIPAQVAYVHPLHNLALLSFDPALLDGTPIKAARLEPRDLVPGEAVTVVGLGSDSRVRSIATTVASIDDVKLPLSRTLQFREANLEVATLVNPPGGLRRGRRRPRRPRAGALVELRDRERPRHGAGQSRRADRPGRGTGRDGPRGAAAVFAGGRVRGGADFRRAQARAAGRRGCATSSRSTARTARP